jgi:hypothetical protein
MPASPVRSSGLKTRGMVLDLIRAAHQGPDFLRKLKSVVAEEATSSRLKKPWQ